MKYSLCVCISQGQTPLDVADENIADNLDELRKKQNAVSLACVYMSAILSPLWFMFKERFHSEQMSRYLCSMNV